MFKLFLYADKVIFNTKLRIEAMHILLAYNNIKLFQMDVKSAFLNGFIKEVYVEQPLGLRVLTFHNMFTN